MRIKLLLPCLFAFSVVAAQKNAYLLVGTYTSGKSEGIYVYTFNTATAENNLVSVAKTKNPSYLAVSPDKKNVYSVNETADTTGSVVGGGVTAFSFDATTGKLTYLDTRPSGGTNPCYVSVDNSGKWVFAGNYSSGSLAMFPVAANGSIEAASQVIAQSGTGPNKDRQEGPHVHATVVSPDNKYLFVPNLGTDKVMIYAIDHQSGKLNPAPEAFVATAPGSGPRHFTFAPNKKYAYLMEELSGNVIAYRYDNGKLNQIQSISCLQTDFKGITGAAGIQVSPDGKFLYCSNRGDANLITIFSIDKKDGRLTVAGYQSTLGKTPRNFNFDPTGNFLLVANQQSDEIVIFKIDKKKGLLTDTGKRINVGSPVCIKWIE
jgi:6-phosphogluconolactonase